MSTVIMVKGKVITSQQIAGFQTSAANVHANISVWANAGTIQLYKGNSNWLNAMFALEAFRLKSGKLSAFGKSVLAYIKAHAPLVHYNPGKGKISRTGNPKDRLWNVFTVPGLMELDDVYEKEVPTIAIVPVLDEAGNKVLDDDGTEKFVPTFDFTYSFSQFLNLKAEPKAPSTAPLKASTVSGQLVKAVEALENKNFSASAAEAIKLAHDLADLYAKVYGFASLLDGALPAIDVDMAERLAASGQKGKSAKAGDKVEGAPVSDEKLTLTPAEKRAAKKAAKDLAAATQLNAELQKKRDVKAADDAAQKALEAIAGTALTVELAESAEAAEAGTVVDVVNPVGSFTLAEVI